MAFLAVSALYPQFSTTTWMAVIPKPRTPIRKVLRKRQKKHFSYWQEKQHHKQVIQLTIHSSVTNCRYGSWPIIRKFYTNSFTTVFSKLFKLYVGLRAFGITATTCEAFLSDAQMEKYINSTHANKQYTMHFIATTRQNRKKYWADKERQQPIQLSYIT